MNKSSELKTKSCCFIHNYEGIKNGNTLVKGSDYYTISPLINEWWGGRQMSDMLPKLFFDHFTNTSFVAEKEGEIVGFLLCNKCDPFSTA